MKNCKNNIRTIVADRVRARHIGNSMSQIRLIRISALLLNNPRYHV